MKRLSTEAYQALRDALAVITWFRNAFESYLKTALREHPELTAGLDFTRTKREVADELVTALARQENRYQEVAIGLMLEVASRERFPDIERLTEPDRAHRLDEAKAAVAHLRAMTDQFAEHLADRQRIDAERTAHIAEAAALKQFADDIAALKSRFLDLHSRTDPQQRGRDFEHFLADLFKTFDMEPRLAYSTTLEQIDGSLSFDTDDYIVEAKWLNDSVGRDATDVFAMKVRRKGKNALGLFVAVSGFTRTALNQYSESTPFITMDGADLFTVLEGRVRLDDLMRAKKRHANETGSCYRPAATILAND